MRISAIGCGYLGAVHAAAMASIGHDVVGIDVDETKVEALSQGRASFFEPGLSEILTEGVAPGRLAFTTNTGAAGCRVHFVGVAARILREVCHTAEAKGTPFLVTDYATSRVVVDGRNCLGRDAWRAAGWTYLGMGRP